MEMAERSDESPSGSSWWGSIIDSARNKSASVLEAVKKDLDELSTAVRTEASNAGAAIAGSLKFDEPDSTANTVKKSLSSFLGQVSEALIPSIEEEETEAVLITNSGAVTLTGFQKHLAELQANDDTYLTEPSDDLAEKYQRWLQVVEQDQFTEQRLAKHLTSSQILNDKYLSLVPDSVPHMEFWKRYLFRRALLEDALANAEKAERRAKQEQNSANTVSPEVTVIQTEQPKKCTEDEKIPEEKSSTPDKEDIKWEGEDFECDVELSEEEQARLLAEYEAEIQEREKRKSLASELKEAKPKQNVKSESKPKAPTAKTTATPAKGQKATPQKNAAPPKSAGGKKGAPEGKKQQQQKTATTNSSTEKTDEKLNMEKNHFPKEDASSTSDESWEKEFDLEEQ
ncbi:BSD domain-containing protein 1-A-like [Phlebotomus argentipes]|uniref:BSD domain-containing protein 1-A-like n=1 Tax=Phlebotomus argentipes TaxID=94469 RepID=UPI002892D64D|nr:BSD domain-containing protein 1-A-like [Phlebotomus argentipes]